MATASRSSSFVFVASGPGRGKSVGMRRARSRRALAEALRREKRSLVQTWQLPDWAAGPEPPASLKDQAAMNEQLGQLVARGVPLVDALDVTAQVVSSEGAPRIERIREMVRAGKSFSEACRAAGGFDRVTIAIYAAAERSGDLAGAAARLARNARRQLEIQGKAGTLIIYPAIVLTISAIVAVAMIMFIVPMIGRGLAGSGVELPVVMRVMMGVGLWLRANWLLMLGVLGAAVVALILLRRGIAAGVKRGMRRLPLINKVVLAQELARFFGVMAAMTTSGIPLADALGTSVEAVGHPKLRRQFDKLRQKLIEGGVFRTLIEQVEGLPLASRKLLVAADQAGDLETAFDALASDYSDEVEKRTNRVMAAIEPAMIVVLFLVIGSLVLSIMLPLIQATSSGIG